MKPPDSDLPILKLTVREFEELLEYSASVPTGVFIGKRWKRLEGAFDPGFRKAGGQPRWVIGEYVEVEDKTKAGFKWWKPVIVIRGRTHEAD